MTHSQLTNLMLQVLHSMQAVCLEIAKAQMRVTVGTSCMSEDEYNFALTASGNYALPYLSLDNYVFCYRLQAPTAYAASCSQTAIEGEVGPVDTSNASCPTHFHVAFVKHWFDIIFADFTTLNGDDAAKVAAVKAVLQLWILQFGPHVLSSTEWVDLVSVFNDITPPDWTQFLAWAGSTPQYISDGVVANAKNFPANLSAWLQLESGDLAVFNTFSTLCDSASCTPDIKTACQSALPTSACATAP